MIGGLIVPNPQGRGGACLTGIPVHGVVQEARDDDVRTIGSLCRACRRRRAGADLADMRQPPRSLGDVAQTRDYRPAPAILPRLLDRVHLDMRRVEYATSIATRALDTECLFGAVLALSRQQASC